MWAGLRRRRLEVLDRLSATHHLTAPPGLDQLGSLLGPTTAYNSGMLRGSGRAAEARCLYLAVCGPTAVEDDGPRVQVLLNDLRAEVEHLRASGFP
jgi:hypothetical protein